MDEIRENIMDHYEAPRNHGSLADATVVEQVVNPLCGDRITLYLRVEDDVIAAVGFEGRGCTISQAAASMLTEEVEGRPLAEVRALDDARMLELVAAPLNPARQRCATLALKALHQGLERIETA